MGKKIEENPVTVYIDKIDWAKQTTIWSQ